MKKISIKENELVNLIERLAAEEVETQKTTWLAEQKEIWVKETKIKVDAKLVERIKELEKQLISK